MTNARGKSSVEYDGKTYPIELNMGVLADLQDHDTEAFNGLLKGKDPEIRFIMKAFEFSLIEANEEMTPEQAARLARKVATFDAFSSLFNAAFPDPGPDAGPGLETKPGNGKRPKRAA